MSSSSEDEQEIVLGAFDLITLAAYFALLALISILVGRHQSKVNKQKPSSATETYFLAERSVSWWAVAASLFASNIGSEHFVGLAGGAAASGVAVGFYEVGAIPIVIFVGQFFLPTYLTSKVQTTPEYVEKRYNLLCRTVIVIVSLIIYVLAKVSATLYSGQIILVELLHVNKTIAVAILMAFTVVYTVLGGLEAVIYTETLQTLVLMIGGALVVIFAMTEVGGWNGLVDGLNDQEVSEDFFHFFRSGSDEKYPWTGFVFGLFVIAPWYFGIDQVIVQRALAAKNIAHGQLGCTAAAGLKFLPFVMIILPGMCARVLVGRTLETEENLSDFNFDLAYPWLVLNVVPKNARGIIIASMLSSLMSALASVFNSTATLFALNVWKLYHPDTSEKQLVFVGRITVVVIAVISLCWLPIMPYLGSSLFLIMQLPASFMAPPILCLYLWGMASRIPTQMAGQWTLCAGVGVGVMRFILEVIEDVAGRKMFGTFTSINFLHFAAISFWSCTAMLFALSCLFPDRQGYRCMDEGSGIKSEERDALLFRWSAYWDLMGRGMSNASLKPIDIGQEGQSSGSSTEIELPPVKTSEIEDLTEIALQDISNDSLQVDDDDFNSVLERETSEDTIVEETTSPSCIGRKLILSSIAVLMVAWIAQLIRFW